MNITLTAREQEIWDHVVSGLTSKEIAVKTKLSFFTVQTHRKNILHKLGARNTAQAIATMNSR